MSSKRGRRDSQTQTALADLAAVPRMNLKRRSHHEGNRKSDGKPKRNRRRPKGNSLLMRRARSMIRRFQGTDTKATSDATDLLLGDAIGKKIAAHCSVLSDRNQKLSGKANRCMLLGLEHVAISMFRMADLFRMARKAHRLSFLDMHLAVAAMNVRNSAPKLDVVLPGRAVFAEKATTDYLARATSPALDFPPKGLKETQQQQPTTKKKKPGKKAVTA